MIPDVPETPNAGDIETAKGYWANYKKRKKQEKKKKFLNHPREKRFLMNHLVVKMIFLIRMKKIVR